MSVARAFELYARGLETITNALSSGLGRQGRFVARKPRTVILVALALVGACAAGFARIHGQSNADKLWCGPLPASEPPYIEAVVLAQVT